MQLGGIALIQAPFEHLTTHQNRSVTSMFGPDQRWDRPLFARDGGQLEQFDLRLVGALEGHHRGGAAKVDGQGSDASGWIGKMKVLFASRGLDHRYGQVGDRSRLRGQRWIG